MITLLFTPIRQIGSKCPPFPPGPPLWQGSKDEQSLKNTCLVRTSISQCV
jgi:hypothetical protein